MEMETRDEILEDWVTPASPIEVIQQLSEEAVRRAGEAWHTAISGSSIPIPRPPQMEMPPRHRRTRSELVVPVFRRSNSTTGFQRWKSHMQKALHWGNRSFREDNQYSSFDPEILANQKRQWYQFQSKASDAEKYQEATALFENFVITGLPPDVNLETVEDAFIKRKKWEQEMARSEIFDASTRQYRKPTLPALEPQVLFKYPPGQKLALRSKDLAAFCFPGGVKARVLERTPSLNQLNQLVYGQEHLCKDDLSFMFSLKVADNATLYGVCLHVEEIVQKPHVMSGIVSPLSRASLGCSRFMVAAPRCYCILTRVPFFELHYEILNSIIAQERLNRITQFVNEMALADSCPSPSTLRKYITGNLDSHVEESTTDWMASAIPVDSATALTAAAAGILSDKEVPSKWEIYSPGSATPSDTSDGSEMREWDKDVRNINTFDSYSSSPETRTSGLEKMYGDHSNDITPDVIPSSAPAPLQKFESLFSSARSIVSEDNDDEILNNHDKDSSDDAIMKWARENKSDLLQIICGYHSRPVPDRGSEVTFQPLDHLQAIEYRRPPISALGLCDKYLNIKLEDSEEDSQVKLKLASAEEAVSLSLWSTATLCRVLSLENILTLVTGVLLEKQVVVLCPNLGVLSAVVLSIIPMIRPFEWQSLFLPILPEKMFDFLDAPVPFIVGIQHKLADMKMKTSNLVRVIVGKNKVKTCKLPQLPQHKQLISELKPFHSILSREVSIAHKQPVYKCNEVQVLAATQFLSSMRQYLDSLCADLRLHTITSVQSNNDRVSILIKDSFIDSFDSRDQPFVQLFVETQQFTVLSDCRLSYIENEYK